MAEGVIGNVLASRYASPEMKQIWSEVGKVRLERELWIAVLNAQWELGIPIPDGSISAYQRVLDQVDLASIEARERITKHDVKARIEEFNALAGFELIHRGMTSKDATDNVEQYQILRSLELVRDRTVAVLAKMAEKASDYVGLVIAGRSHNVPAQPITLAKRFANFGEELLLAFNMLEHVIATYPLRGMKGAMGTSEDMLDLFEGDYGKVSQLEQRVAHHLGFQNIMNSVGQIYPRSLDFEVIAVLCQLAAGPSSFVTTLRLMAGNELATEGFRPGQVGSSAMPHKMNARTSERINGCLNILRGHLMMAAGQMGGQWNEGDVSDSISRRVFLADAFFTIDGLLQAYLTVLNDFGAYPAMAERELRRYLPFLSSTAILMAVTKAGVGRETAHEAIKEHAVAAALAMREEGTDSNDLIDRLVNDPRLPVDRAVFEAALADPLEFTGMARFQTGGFVRSVGQILFRYPDAAAYRPNDIL